MGHALLAAALLAGSCAAPSVGASDWPLPGLVVWAWDRPEDLRFLPAGVGVAYLDATVTLIGTQVEWRPRVSSLLLAGSTPTVPVVRIETATAPATLPTLDDAQRAELLRQLVGVATAHGALQIDYEAPLSQRDFYRRLLADLRDRLGPGFPLSVTALASWCLGDRWMADLPVDEIVPMYYRLGGDGRRLRAQLAGGVDVAPECRRAHGLITDEPIVRPPTDRRLYLFSPTAWRPAAVDRAVAQLARKAKDGP